LASWLLFPIAVSLETWLWILNVKAAMMRIPEANPLLVRMSRFFTEWLGRFLRITIHYENLVLVLQPVAFVLLLFLPFLLVFPPLWGFATETVLCVALSAAIANDRYAIRRWQKSYRLQRLLEQILKNEEQAPRLIREYIFELSGKK
jgi:hypothetical protein